MKQQHAKAMAAIGVTFLVGVGLFWFANQQRSPQAPDCLAAADFLNCNFVTGPGK